MECPVNWVDLVLFDQSLPEEKGTVILETLWARALGYAPCLREDDHSVQDHKLVRSVIIAAALRWMEGGAGGIQSRSAGDYSETFTSNRRGLFRPDELDILRSVCAQRSGFWQMNTMPQRDHTQRGGFTSA